MADEAIGSKASFVRYGLEGGWLWPHFGERLVLAVRGLLDRVDGPNIPFFELSELGGDETLRGFGENRFLDEGRVLVNAEERFRVFQINYGNVRTEIESRYLRKLDECFTTSATWAPARSRRWLVAAYAFSRPLKSWQRSMSEWGAKGVAIFTGLDYPF